MNKQRSPGPWKAVATHMWKKAGEPERDSEPTSVGRHNYDGRAKDVIRALLDMGYKIVPPARIHLLGPQKRKPKAGDRRETKKHGVQVRVHERHNGMLVRSGSRYCYTWVSLSDQRAASYLTLEERPKATTRDPKP